MLSGIHFLLTYTCNLECDHCFLYCGPNARGTFTLKQIKEVLEQAIAIGTIEWIYFEGGEPLLYYPLMLEGIRIARDMGFKTGVVTNAYMATSDKDAELWLKPLSELEISNVSISDDPFHCEDKNNNSAKRALDAAKRLGIPVASITIKEPTIEKSEKNGPEKGSPVVGGGAMFKGRAVEKLTEGLPRRCWQDLTECPHEDLKDPARIHVDSYGNVHLCQGLSLGNMWQTSLSVLVKTYNANSHPICGPLLKGGPALLVKEYDVEYDEKYVDECHLCYLTRLALIDKFPEYLAPRQTYGLQ